MAVRSFHRRECRAAHADIIRSTIRSESGTGALPETAKDS
ncbi:hypothetical protein NSERUTF1_2309 [Nocardia seriolae]|nr:hypothetical protein NSERUTF1_2309 [Nocardia seriolae]